MAARKSPAEIEAERSARIAKENEHQADIAAMRKVGIAPLTEYRRLRRDGSDLEATKYYSQHETEIARARALERQPVETAPTQAQRDARVFENAAQRESDANAIRAFEAWQAEPNMVRRARMLDANEREIFRGRELAQETPTDEPPPHAA